MVKAAGDWPWSSYRAMVGDEAAAPWLETDWVLGQFGRQRRRAQERYAEFVVEGLEKSSVWEALRHQVFLGSEAFVEATGALMPTERVREVPRAQRRAMAKRLVQFEAAHPDRGEAMARAFLGGGYTMQQIADHFGVHYSTVSRAVKQLEQDGRAQGPRSGSRGTA